MINLCIDIGNTNLVFCLFNTNKLSLVIRENTESLNGRSLKKIMENFKKYKLKLNIIISSVVPTSSKILEKFLSSNSYNFIRFRDILKKFNFSTDIKNKRSIGDDRIINILYAQELFVKSMIIVDFGTATTFDVLDKQKKYSGGVITPGIDISLKVLKKNTAKLPLVDFKETKNVIGDTTIKAIRSGFFWGYVSMVKGLIKKIETEKKSKFNVILTGGNSNSFRNILNNVKLIDPYFTSRGLNHLLIKYINE